MFFIMFLIFPGLLCAPVVLFCEGVVPFAVITLYDKVRMNLSFYW